MALPLIFVGQPDPSAAWIEAIRRLHDFELLAVIDLAAGEVEGMEEALVANPDAAVAVCARGPREASAAARLLVDHAGPTLLHPAPAHPPAGSGVQLTHGWLSLSALGPLEQLFDDRVESVRVVARGIPEGTARGLAEPLYHALTVVDRFSTRVLVERAVLNTERELKLHLSVDEVPWIVDAHCRGHGLRVTVRTMQSDFTWEIDELSESLRRRGAEPRAMPLVPFEERCLRQLVSPVKGADLADAREVQALIDVIEQKLERRIPPSRPAPVDRELGIAALGLNGVLPPVAPLAPTAPPSTDLPIEAIAYSLELRPAVYLTVPPQDEAKVTALLPGVVLRSEHQPLPANGDHWIDDRSRGEPHVHLYAAKDEAHAEQLRDLMQNDPVASLTTIGALLGYPACCVQTFATQGDLSDPTYNRIAIAARTAEGPGPWPPTLDDTSLKLLPHFACTYRCERSDQQVRDLLTALADENADLRAKLMRYLGGPVLYFDQDHQLRFDGEVQDGFAVRYRAVSMPWSPSESFAQLAGAVALGDRLVLTTDALSVYRNDERLFSLDRTDPGLGAVFPFGREITG